MKTINHIYKNLGRYAAVLAVAGLTSLPRLASAEDQVKGAEKLMQLSTIVTAADAEAVAAGDTVVMSCPKCKSTWVTVVEAPTKTGAKSDTRIMERHECPGCEHKFVVEGQGKAKTTKLVHVCKKCGSEDAFCCVMKKK